MNARIRFAIARFAMALLLATALIAPLQALAGTTSGGIAAASDGNGTVHLFWFPPANVWPQSGWNVTDQNGRALAHVVPDAAGAKVWRQLLEASPSARRDKFVVVTLRIASDHDFARSLGLAVDLHGVAPGPHRYVVRAVSGSVRFESSAIDSSRTSPLPTAPGGFSATSVRGGALLRWNAVRQSGDSTVGYAITRSSSDRAPVTVTSVPTVAGVGGHGAFLDAGAPPNQPVTYEIHAIDIFGRAGPAARASTTVRDVYAMYAPSAISATATNAGIRVAWTTRSVHAPAGWVIDRATIQQGPYEPVERRVFAPNTSSFVDTDVRAGTTYWYRVRAVGIDGALGLAPAPRAATANGGNSAETVQRFTARIQPGRVHLSWAPVPRVAGYLVERLGDNGKWSPLTGRPVIPPFYNDPTGKREAGSRTYRVVTVAFTSALSAPSSSVSVTLTDTTPVAAPRIRSASGANGLATIAFDPAPPVAKAARFIVTRAGGPHEAAVVVGEPLPESARRFVDASVLGGATYWYRIYALDAHGNRSAPSEAIVIRPESRALPTPAAPSARFDAKPFARVTVRYALEPGLAVMLQRRSGTKGAWLTIGGPLVSTSAVDTDPPSGTVYYRVLYRDRGRHYSAPSNATTVEVPK